jgi:hypothetical protein
MLQGTRRVTYWLAWCCMLSTTLLIIICMIIVPIPVGQQYSVPCVLIPLQSVVFALVATILTWSPHFDVPAFLFLVVFIFYAFSPFPSLLCSSLSCSSLSCLTEFHCNQIQRQTMLCQPEHHHLPFLGVPVEKRRACFLEVVCQHLNPRIPILVCCRLHP